MFGICVASRALGDAPISRLDGKQENVHQVCEVGTVAVVAPEM
jgi:hypothetical protein